LSPRSLSRPHRSTATHPTGGARNAPKLALALVADEPLTEENRPAIAEADAWSQHNTPIALETVLADFGLTMTDWGTMAKTPLAEENSNPNGYAGHPYHPATIALKDPSHPGATPSARRTTAGFSAISATSKTPRAKNEPIS
jgi:hypothetical protein